MFCFLFVGLRAFDYCAWFVCVLSVFAFTDRFVLCCACLRSFALCCRCLSLSYAFLGGVACCSLLFCYFCLELVGMLGFIVVRAIVCMLFEYCLCLFSLFLFVICCGVYFSIVGYGVVRVCFLFEFRVLLSSFFFLFTYVLFLLCVCCCLCVVCVCLHCYCSCLVVCLCMFVLCRWYSSFVVDLVVLLVVCSIRGACCSCCVHGVCFFIVHCVVLCLRDVVVDISRLLVLLCFGGIRLLVKLFSTLFCCWQYCVWGVILLVHPFLERVVLSVLLVVFVLLCAC